MTPERGKGGERPLRFPGLGINATALRFLGFLSDKTIKVSVENFKVTLPHPARFALHKLIIAQRRRNQDKKDKDNMTALEVLNDLVEVGEKESIRLAYEDLHKQWQKRVDAGLKSLGHEEILENLK